MPILIIFAVAILYAIIKNAVKNGVKEAKDENINNKDKIILPLKDKQERE